MTRKKGIALIISLTLIVSIALPGTLAFSGDSTATNESITLAEDTPVPTPENSVEEKGCTCDPKPAEGEPHGEGCPFYASVMGTAAAAEGTDSPVTEPAAGHIRIQINVFCVDDSNEAKPQPDVTVEVRRELYGDDYYAGNEPLPGWTDELPMFSGTSDTSGVVYIDVPYTVVKDSGNNEYDTAYLGDSRDNNHVILQRKAEPLGNLIRFTIKPADTSWYELNDVSGKIRNWKKGTNVTQIPALDDNVYCDNFAFTSGILDDDGQENAGAYVEFDLYVKKTASTEEPTTEEPTEETVNINYVSVGPADAMNFGSVDPASETVKLESGTALGSTPTPGTGFKFVGWFKDQTCTLPVDATWIGSNNKITPQKTPEAYEAATYYAKFDYAVADLTIKQDGGIADENQTFIYVVTGGDLPASGIKVAVNGKSSVTIKNLKIGSYTVTEETNWNWRCGTTGGSQSITLQGAQTNEVSFPNTVSNSKWLSGNAYSKFENK